MPTFFAFRAWFVFFILSFFLGFGGAPALAQEMEAVPPEAFFFVDDAVQMERNAIFDASASVVDPGAKKITYRWDFGDGETGSGIEAVHRYKNNGTYKVVLEIEADGQIARREKEIFVYRKFTLMLTDMSSQKTYIESLVGFAKNEGVYLQILAAFDSASPFISEEILVKRMSENIEQVREADEFLIWTHGEAGFNAFNRFIQNSQRLSSGEFQHKIFMIIRSHIDRNSFTKPLFSFQPRQIFLAKEASIYPFLQSKPGELATNLEAGGYEYRLIDEASQKLYPWNFLNYLLNTLIEYGISESALLLLLMLPVIALVVVFMRQVVGLTTYGLYTPLILAISFMVLGLKFALLTLFLTVAVSTAVRLLLRNARMLYIPRLGIVVTIVALSLFAFLFLGISLQLFDRQFFSIAIFPMLILGILAEKFTSVQSKQSFYSTLLTTLQTVFTAIIAYILVGGEVELGFVSLQWSFIYNSLRLYPELIFFILVLMIFLGKWTGLRLVEYMRFREILRHQEE